MTTARDLKTLHSKLKAAVAAAAVNRAEFFEPYPKQQEFFDLGLIKRERLLIAGNQLGKTEAGAFEATCHLTGDYPDWWLGRRWDRPVRMWLCGETSLLVRDVQQKKLCGDPAVESSFGTGMIPKAKFEGKPSLARGVTDAYDTISVKHKSGGVSTGTFKSYEQGRKKFQGEPVDIVWGDEEPPMDVYSEMLTRVTATKGMVYITFTPLQGRSDVVIRYLDEPDPGRGVVSMTINDALHFTPEERAAIIAGYPAHEREARAKGVPMLGSGRIFPYTEESIMEPALTTIPLYWPKLWGIDFGIGHPFAAVLAAIDLDNDVIHILHVIRFSDGLPLNHAAAMKPIGIAVPVAWPQDGTHRDKGSGEALAPQYRKQGLKMLPDPAMWPEGGNSTEAGVLEMQQRMTTGRLKIASHLSEWFEEYRFYHRKDGQIVKIKDDLMSATRILVMAKRFARLVPLGGKRMDRSRTGGVAKGTDFDYFG